MVRSLDLAVYRRLSELSFGIAESYLPFSFLLFATAMSLDNKVSAGAESACIRALEPDPDSSVGHPSPTGPGCQITGETDRGRIYSRCIAFMFTKSAIAAPTPSLISIVLG